jgi:hypothetical protein
VSAPAAVDVAERSWSLSELALTISLVELGGAWTALVWI